MRADRAQPMALLTIISPETPERSVELEPHNTLGRHPDNTIQILDRIVSKNHCHIDLVGDQYVLKDLGSLNGTYINGERVQNTHPLRPGDEVTLGGTKMVFDAPGAQEGEGGKRAAGLVTMAPGMVESHVRAKLLQAAEQNFVPERLVTDVAALRRDYEKLRVSFELTRAIAAELDVDRLLAKILATAFQLLPVDRGVVLLLDEREKLLPRCVKTKRGDGTEQVALSTTIINQVLTERSAVLSSDALMDARFKGAQSIIMQGIRSSMAVPLIYSEQLLGIMVLDSQVAANAFSEKDLQLTQALANQAAVAIQNSLYAAKIEKEALTRQRFQRLLSPAIAELVVSGEVEVEKGGQSRETSVFFSDIRGFTAMSEKRTAEEIVDMLNEYFELMVEVVFKYEGTLDKFVGDEIMALFGSPVSHPDDAYRAVKVAVEQVQALEEWNLVRVAEGEEPITIGIGVNTGRVVAGYLGSSKALEYTVIGDVVNTASRLCSTAKAGEILISRSTYEKVKDFFQVEELAPVQVKNKAQPLPVYRVLGERRRRTQG
ncbi:MAG: adenylate/guanylate cyclase domain-containing protein [Polyangiales bacterium]